MTDKALTVQNQDLTTNEIGNILAKSGYFQDARDASQAIVKVLAGRELGLGPIASMTGVYIVKGRPALSANLLAGVLKRSGKYNYRVLTAPADRAKVCEIAFFERDGDKWTEIGRSVFSLEDAKRAGTQNMDRFPANMLFARAMTNGIRWYAPDIFAGGVYTPEELGAPVDEAGEVIEARPVVIEEQKPATNGNSKHSELVARYNALSKHATELGIQHEPAEAFANDKELTDAGRALNIAVKARESEIEYQNDQAPL